MFERRTKHMNGKKKKTQQSFIVSFLLSLVWFDRRFRKSINITNSPNRIKVEEEEEEEEVREKRISSVTISLNSIRR